MQVGSIERTEILSKLAVNLSCDQLSLYLDSRGFGEKSMGKGKPSSDYRDASATRAFCHLLPRCHRNHHGRRIKSLKVDYCSRHKAAFLPKPSTGRGSGLRNRRPRSTGGRRIASFVANILPPFHRSNIELNCETSNPLLLLSAKMTRSHRPQQQKTQLLIQDSIRTQYRKTP